MRTPADAKPLDCCRLYRNEAWELCGLAWEDIDLTAGTITVKRNLTQTYEFTLPKPRRALTG